LSSLPSRIFANISDFQNIHILFPLTFAFVQWLSSTNNNNVD